MTDRSTSALNERQQANVESLLKMRAEVAELRIMVQAIIEHFGVAVEKK